MKQWRRERDSNPRYPFGYSGFQDRLFQPLTHPSAGALITVYQVRESCSTYGFTCGSGLRGFSRGPGGELGLQVLSREEGRFVAILLPDDFGARPSIADAFTLELKHLV